MFHVILYITVNNSKGLIQLSKAKGIGKGTGKKGWNRWQAAENRAKDSQKPYKSKGTKDAVKSEKKSK